MTKLRVIQNSKTQTTKCVDVYTWTLLITLLCSFLFYNSQPGQSWMRMRIARILAGDTCVLKKPRKTRSFCETDTRVWQNGSRYRIPVNIVSYHHCRWLHWCSVFWCFAFASTFASSWHPKTFFVKWFHTPQPSPCCSKCQSIHPTSFLCCLAILLAAFHVHCHLLLLHFSNTPLYSISTLSLTKYCRTFHNCQNEFRVPFPSPLSFIHWHKQQLLTVYIECNLLQKVHH